MSDEALRVVCLCAGWCGVCRDYRAVFDAAATQAGAMATFAWVDIEDEAELVGEIDVETFPTLLIARGARALFFGPITPQPGTLARLVQRAVACELTSPADGADNANGTDTAEVHALAARLSARG
jgi:thioredoxin 1